MPFARPTLPELRDRIRRDFSARLPGTDALLRSSNLRVIADVIAGVSTLHYGFQVWLSQQLFPDTAEGPFLERWASIWGVQRRPATAAFGPLSLAGNANAAVPVGTEWQRTDGVKYTTATGTTLGADGTGTVVVEAVDAAAAGNADVGTGMTTTTAVVGLLAQAIVADPGIAGGADIEPDDELRTRLLARIQFPPQGGAASDYVRWALEVPGVARAWVYPMEQGPGTVTVRFTMQEDIRPPNGIPTQADVDLVAAHIATVRPVTAQVFVVAPEPLTVDVTVAALTPDTVDTRANADAELRDVFRRDDCLPGGTLFVSWLWEAVSRASGERHHSIVDPPGDVTVTVNQLPVMGTVTYVA